MATTLDELVVKLSADVSDLSKGMEEGTRVISDSTNRMEQSIANFSESSQGHMFNFSHVAETALGVFGGEALIEGIHKLGELVKEVFTEMVTESIKAAEAQEDAVNRLNIAMASAGQYSKEASTGFQEFAHSLQSTTVYSEESVMQAGALIESLGKLDKDGLQKATTAAVNLAAMLRIDLNTAAMMVGKAAEGNIAVFNRYGMAIEQGATKAETFANVLKAVGAAGDVAAEQANTYAGAMAQLNHAHEDGSKIMGEVVVKNQAIIEAVKALTGLFDEHNEATKKNTKAYKEFVAEGLLMAIDAIVAFGAALDAVYRVGASAFEAVRGAAYTMSLGIVTAIDGPIFAISGLLSLIPGIGKAFEKVRDDAAKHMTDASAEIEKSAKAIDEHMAGPTKAFDMLSDAALKVRDGAERGLAAVSSGADATVEPLNRSYKAAQELSDGLTKLGDEGLKLVQQMDKNDISKVYEKDVSALNAALAQKKISRSQYNAAVDAETASYMQSVQQANEKEVDDLMKKNALMTKLDANKYKEDIKSNQTRINTLLAQEGDLSEHKIAVLEKQKAAEDVISKQRTQAGMTALNDLATFQNAKSSEMAAVGKAAAIASATISTYEGAGSAYKALAGIPVIGPELGVAAAAAAIAAGIGRVAMISGVQLAGGIDEVPGIGSQDNFPAVLAPNERVVPADTNKDLKTFLAMALGKMGNGGGDSGGKDRLEISFKGDLINWIEAKIIERQRLNISLLPRLG